MKVELVDLEEFSGNKAHIYSVLLDDAEDTLFDQFVEENGPLYPNEIREIVYIFRSIPVHFPAAY